MIDTTVEVTHISFGDDMIAEVNEREVTAAFRLVHALNDDVWAIVMSGIILDEAFHSSFGKGNC